MTLTQDLKDEFTKRKVFFADCKPSWMYKGKFPRTTIPMLVFRLFAASFSIVVLVKSFTEEQLEPPGKILIYVTYWSFILIILYFLLSSTISLLHLLVCREETVMPSGEIRPPENPEVLQRCIQKQDLDKAVAEVMNASSYQLPWYMKVQWGLYNICLPSSYMITVMYWSILHPIYGGKLNLVNIGVHIMNAAFMMIEQFLGSIPTRLAHMYQPMLFCFVYTIFSIVIYATAGFVVYPSVIDWSNPGKSIGIVAGILLYFAAAQFLLYFIYRGQTRQLVRQNRGHNL